MLCQLHHNINTIDIDFAVHILLFCKSIRHGMLRWSLYIVSRGYVFIARIQFLLNSFSFDSANPRSNHCYSTSHHHSYGSNSVANQSTFTPTIFTANVATNAPAIIKTESSAILSANCPTYLSTYESANTAAN